LPSSSAAVTRRSNHTFVPPAARVSVVAKPAFFDRRTALAPMLGSDRASEPAERTDAPPRTITGV
jgi:hypothetical protein